MKNFQRAREWPPHSFPGLTDLSLSKKLVRGFADRYGQCPPPRVVWEVGWDWLTSMALGGCFETNVSVVTIAIVCKCCRKVPFHSPGQPIIASGLIPLCGAWSSSRCPAQPLHPPQHISQRSNSSCQLTVCCYRQKECLLWWCLGRLGCRECHLGMKNWNIWKEKIRMKYFSIFLFV